MESKKILKVITINLSVAFVNIIFFSPGLIGLTLFSSNALVAAFSAVLLLLSGIILVYGNYKIITTKPKQYVKLQKLEDEEDYVNALKISKEKSVFIKDIDLILIQLERVKKAKHTILGVLLPNRFDKKELSYRKFEAVILELEKMFYKNIKGVCNQINAFDLEDYQHLIKTTKTQDETKISRIQEYEECIQYVRQVIEVNEQMLLKLDRLTFEVAKLDSPDISEVANMPEIQEIEDLVRQINLYK